MGLFGEIYRGVLNEIKADDAYNRFYSNMPREDFDAIVGGQQNIDKFVQFFLNCVRDGKSTAGEAVAALSMFKNADELVKQNVKKMMEDGEYDDAEDVSESIKHFSNGGGVLSKKTFSKEGYVKVAENERWLVTCTTNYQANTDIFGKLGVKWCTASDRGGNYDGFRMFKGYTNEAALIQFRWKGKVSAESTNDYEPLETGEEGFVGEKIPYNYQLIQVAAKMPDEEGSLRVLGNGGLCDFTNHQLSRSTLWSIVGEKMYQILEDESIMGKLIQMTSDMREKEEEFQNYTDRSIARKKERRQALAVAKFEKLQKSCEEKLEKKKNFIKSKWDEFVKGKKYEDEEFLKDIINVNWNRVRPNNGGEQFVADHNYVLAQTQVIGNKHDMVVIKPTLGFYKMAMLYDNEQGLPDAKIDFPPYQNPTSFDEFGAVYMICEYLGKNNYKPVYSIGYVEGNSKLSRGWSVHTRGDDDIENDDFLCLRFVKDGGFNYYLYDVKAGSLMDTGKIAPIDGYPMGNDNYILVNSAEYKYELYWYAQGKNGLKPVLENVAYATSFDTQIVLVNDDKKSQTIVCDTGDRYKVNTMDKIVSIDKKQMTRYYVPICLSKDGRSGFNGLFLGSGELIFGFNSRSPIGYTGQDSCFSVMRSGSKQGSKVVFYQGGKYFVREGNPFGGKIKEEPCDKYGKTEKERLSDRNMEKYWKGYSPEVQKQMDDMWDERNGKDSDGSEAMKDWNDDDAYLFNFKKNNPYMQNLDWDKKLYTTLQNGIDSDEWKDAYYGEKDPEAHDKEWDRLWAPGHEYMKKPRDEREPGWLTKFVNSIDNNPAPDFMRRNPYYRVDKHGKAIDQPWYDEDEIPAVPSDRVIRESKTDDALDRIKSILDRMGLND